MEQKRKILFVVALLAILGGVAVVAAASYYLISSSPVTVTVTSGAINVTLATNSTSVTDKDVLLLTATIVSANGNSLMCHFYENGTQIGPAVAIVNLQAQMTAGPLSSGNTYIFTAGP